MSTSPWILHVKSYQAQHGGSYKDAMSNARASYQPQRSIDGGKFNLKKAFKRGKSGLKQANQFYDQNSALINTIAGEDNAKLLATARGYSGQADALTGGKFNLNRAMRKTVNTAKEVKRYARVAAPILSVVAPEIGVPLQAAVMATGGSFRVQGGGKKIRKGGVGAAANCTQCGCVALHASVKSYDNPNRQ